MTPDVYDFGTDSLPYDIEYGIQMVNQPNPMRQCRFMISRTRRFNRQSIIDAYDNWICIL